MLYIHNSLIAAARINLGKVSVSAKETDRDWAGGKVSIENKVLLQVAVGSAMPPQLFTKQNVLYFKIQLQRCGSAFESSPKEEREKIQFRFSNVCFVYNFVLLREMFI